MIMLIKSRHLVISLYIFGFFFHIHVLEAYINKIDFKAFLCTVFRILY